MNVGELLRERDRLQAVIEEAKTARFKLTQVNKLIALYGDDSTAATTNGKPAAESIYCGKCDAGPFKGNIGIGRHNTLMHGGKVKVAP